MWCVPNDMFPVSTIKNIKSSVDVHISNQLKRKFDCDIYDLLSCVKLSWTVKVLPLDINFWPAGLLMLGLLLDCPVL
jgi:hypothetical protein